MGVETKTHPGLANSLLRGSVPAFEEGRIQSVDVANHVVDVFCLSSLQVARDVRMAQPYYSLGRGSITMPEVGAICLVWWLSHQRPVVWGFLPQPSTTESGPNNTDSLCGDYGSDGLSTGEHETVGPDYQYMRFGKNGDIILSDSALDSICFNKMLGQISLEAMRIFTRTEAGDHYEGVHIKREDSEWTEASSKDSDGDAFLTTLVERIYDKADGKPDNYSTTEGLIRAIRDKALVVDSKKRYPLLTRIRANVVNDETQKQRMHRPAGTMLASRELIQNVETGEYVYLKDTAKSGEIYEHRKARTWFVSDLDVEARVRNDLKVQIDKGLSLHLGSSGTGGIECYAQGDLRWQSTGYIDLIGNVRINPPGVHAQQVQLAIPLNRKDLDIEELGVDEQLATTGGHQSAAKPGSGRPDQNAELPLSTTLSTETGDGCGAGASGDTGSDNLDRWNDYIDEGCKRYGVPANLAKAVIMTESSGNPNAGSSAGAVGLMQLMPSTAAGLGVDPYDNRQNVIGGIRYLRMQYDAFGSWDAALVAYNGGPARAKDYLAGKAIPSETSRYVPKVKKYWNTFCQKTGNTASENP